MDLIKRFLKYVSFDTQSDENSTTSPSTSKQLLLGKYLVNELKSIGLKDAFIDEYGIVYASLEANVEGNYPTIGLIAHMDTSPDCSGKDIKPRMINNYDGSDIRLNDNLVMNVEDFPSLKNNIGEDLIVTDGNTLLGADDKAGIAIIVESIYRIINDKNHKHGKIKIAFTPDEEVGRGTEHFDVDFFDADFAYTLDGGDIHFIEYENFNASSAKVVVTGFNIHPGSAKDKMVNSITLANEFDNLLSKESRPERTDMYDGFYHLNSIDGNVEKTTLHYIIREHDINKLHNLENDLLEAANKLNNKYGHRIEVIITPSYKNMKEIIMEHKEVLEQAYNAFKVCDVPFKNLPIRGGTDGANLSFRGLPCPNLGDGGYNFHGRYEYVSTTQMQQMVKIVKELLRVK